MDLYGSLNTIHVIGVALLFISLGFEAVAARRLQRAATADGARSASKGSGVPGVPGTPPPRRS